MLMYVTSSIKYWDSIHIPYHVHTPFQMAQCKPFSSDYKNSVFVPLEHIEKQIS